MLNETEKDRQSAINIYQPSMVFEANLNQSIDYALIETRLDERFSNAFWKQNAIYFQGIRANRTKE